jgi:hypothetical protein
LNTELNEAAAKRGIVRREEDDPELDAALSAAHQFQLELVREQNRHKEAMRGFLGRVFGHDDNVPSYIAASGMAVGLVIFAACLFTAGKSSDTAAANFWAQQAERSLAFAASCLAFIFGKGISK